MAVSISVAVSGESSVLEDARMLISKVAADARNDKGTSLYDEIIPYTKDNTALAGIADTGVRNIQTRLIDVISSVSLSSGSYTVSLDIPDVLTDSGSITNEAKKYVALFVAATWLDAKGQAMGKDYATEATASMERLVALVKTRKAPVRTTV